MHDKSVWTSRKYYDDTVNNYKIIQGKKSIFHLMNIVYEYLLLLLFSFALVLVHICTMCL